MATMNGVSSALAAAINQRDRVTDRPRHPSEPTSTLHGCKPVLLLRADAACGGLHLNAGEHGQALPDVLGADRDGAPANQVTGAARQAEGDEPAGARVGEAANGVAEQASIWACAER